MPPRTSSKSTKTKAAPKKNSKSTGVSKTHALEKKLVEYEAEIARLSSEKQLLAKEKDQRATELQIINNIGQTLTEGLDLQNTIDRVGDRLRDSLKVENIGISVWDENLENIIATYYYRSGKPASSETWLAGDVKMALRLAARGGGRSWVVNRNAEKSWRKFGGVNEVDAPKSFVQLPLLAGGKLVGGITIADYKKEDAFTDLSVGMLETISSNMGTAIQNVRLFDETQRLLKETDQRATELQIINNIGQTLTEGGDLNTMTQRVGERIQEALQVSNLVVSLLDKKTGHVLAPYMVRNGKQVTVTEENVDMNRYKLAVRASARAGGASWVVNTNAEKSWRKFWISPVDNEVPKSFVSMPFLAGKEVIGGITIADYENENAFSDLSVNLLETIASNMGTAIQNVRLFDETQHLLKETEQRATELQIINNIGQTLTEGLDLNSMIERVAARLHEVLKVDNIAITIINPNTGQVISQNNIFHSTNPSFNTNRFSLDKFKSLMRLSARGQNRSWVMNTNAEKSWRKYAGNILEGDSVPKSFVALPLLVGKSAIGGIIFADYEKENAFIDLPIRMLETIAYNMGTGIQNVLLFDETQRLLKETEQRATELQIINNIGQTLTEGGDLENMIQRVGERIQVALNINNIAISIFDKETERVIAPYMVRKGEQIKLTQENFDLRRYKMLMRAWARAGGGSSSWVLNRDIDKFWQKNWLGPVANDAPKSLVVIPFVADGEIIGGISLADYERENAFSDISVNLLETIASNMGTAVQNVRLFEETKRLFAEAEESRAAAEQANKAKSTFLANMSHELRTPLNAIMGFTQIVKGKAEGVMPEKQVNNLDKVLTSSQHLLGLINTVLDIAKIEAGRMDAIPGKFSLGGFADQCLALATPLLKPNVTLEKQVDETIGFVFSDQDKIKQIILNLLSNAAKFTHEGNIILKVEKLAGEMISISVKDSGIGISEEAVGRVFEEFQQADVSTTRQYGGTGLGLTISRNLARLLGGDLTAASVLGEGSTFTLTFPMHYEKDPALRQAQDNASSAAIVDPVHSAEAAPTESSGKDEANSESQTQKTILIVEDTELNVNFITQLLEDDYNLLFAKNGAQGVTLAELEKPDLILMDISLPIMDGYEATRRIRVNMADTPIIGLSAYAMVGDAEKAKAAGCNDYVTKPVNGNLLKQKIKAYLR